MTRILIGIHAYTQPDRLQATLDSIQANTTRPVEVLLLVDGPDDTLQATLPQFAGVAQSSTPKPLGAPTCFNRLAAFNEADVLIFLESGALVGPDWLTHLLAALEADPAHGLAGPSTNRSWNEQAIKLGGITPGRDRLPDVAQVAAEAAHRFSGQWRTLAPLHSLADFCYAVRREVVAAIGAADEAYGQGPCWEMDYNIRAARAGFKGVWAQAAFVYRPPSTSRRRQMERQLFPAAKKLYQDRFCALRLRGERADYESHCRGEACEHFAPRDLIQIHRPFSRAEPAGPRPPAGPEPDHIPRLEVVPATHPLASCIMPTGNRAPYVRQSIHYWRRQTYPNMELVIVDDGEDGLETMLPADERIRYQRISPGRSIGEKRNEAVRLAHGEYVVHWDDDDWYAPTRLQHQLDPLLHGRADLTAFTGTLFFDLENWQFWRCSPALHRRLFVENVHGGTLAYRRRLWESGLRYPRRSIAEDAFFLRQALRRGARLTPLPNNGHFIYLRHHNNAWKFQTGKFLETEGWQQVAEPPLPAGDHAFYAAQTSNHDASAPLVSCLMPTYNRRWFVAQTIRYFQRQDYPHRELIILDDGSDAIADLVPNDPLIRYQRLARRQTIGAKLNLGCEMAQGDFIAHWDDDDWVAPWRLSYQIQALQANSEVDLCGLDHLLYYQPQQKRGWQYCYPAGQRPWVCGNTFLYRRALWQRHPHPAINEGHDTRYVWQLPAKKILPLDRPEFLVALIHAGNTSPKRTISRRWQPYAVEAIKQLMGSDWSIYAEPDFLVQGPGD